MQTEWLNNLKNQFIFSKIAIDEVGMWVKALAVEEFCYNIESFGRK